MVTCLRQGRKYRCLEMQGHTSRFYVLGLVPYNIKLKFFSRSRTKTYSSIYPALKMLQIPLGKYLDPFEM